MAIFATGAYWNARTLTLRDFSSDVKNFLTNLNESYAEFNTIEWVGNRSTPPVSLKKDFSNLDNLILKYACDDEAVYHELDSNALPTWESFGNFHMQCR